MSNLDTSPPAGAPPVPPDNFGVAPAAPVDDNSETVTMSWAGNPWALAGLGLFNFALTLMTLGIYSFWARTEVRRRIWSKIRLQGEPLHYTGKGSELFLGFLLVFFLFVLPAIALVVGVTIYFGPTRPEPALAQMLVAGIIFFLVGMAIYRARRYRLSRTNWRGIRGTLAGSPVRFTAIHAISYVLIPLTAGWASPWRSALLYRRMTNDMHFGDEAFRTDVAADGLYRRYALLWFGSIAIYVGTGYVLFQAFRDKVELAMQTRISIPFSAWDYLVIFAILSVAGLLYAIVSAGYRAKVIRHFAAATRFGDVAFASRVSTSGLVWQAITNYLISTLSLTILSPVAQARYMRYLVENFETRGDYDFHALAQNMARLDRTGEGLAEAFDIDVF